MKRLLLPAACLFVAPSLQETLEFAPEEGIELTRTFEAHAEYSIDSISLSVDGEVVQETDEIEFSVDSLERIVVTDEIAEVDDGRPTDFRRTFVELTQENTESAGDEENERTSGSDLEGITVRFLWDDGDEEYYVELDDDDDEVEERLLEWLTDDMDMRGVLPDGEVEEGDEWDIDAEAYLTLMWPSGLLGFHGEDEDGVDDYDRGMNQQIVENIEGEGTATFEGLRDEDGTTVAVIRVELSVETWADGETEIEGTELDTGIVLERDVEGEVLWDVESGHLYGAHLEADAEMRITRSRVAETEEGDFDVENEEVYSGSITYDVEIERE
jgi:hypothetical protein